MDILAAKKREVVASLLSEIGSPAKVDVYLCKDNDPKANILPESEHGHFF